MVREVSHSTTVPDASCIARRTFRGHNSFHAPRLVLGCGNLGEVGFIPELNPLFALLFRLAAICDHWDVGLYLK